MLFTGWWLKFKMDTLKSDDLKVFGSYSRYYDLLYQDKDYRVEAKFVDSIIKEYKSKAKTIIDLGCGTGRHDIFLAEKYFITGIDQSEQMLAYAHQTVSSSQSANGTNPIVFHQGDIRKIQLGLKFDCAISLFHVMSYQTHSSDILDVLQTVKKHLSPGGLFIFDFWYGPAVLSERPSVRIKRMEDNDSRVIRLAEPVMHPNENTVDVNYTAVVVNKKTNCSQEIKEIHRMRYFFAPEIRDFLSQSGFEACGIAEWLTNSKPGFHSWNVYVAARVKR
jgi:SAM-dependent methyltransferase